MDLYRRIAKRYEELFPLDEEALALARALLAGRGDPRVLDAGCGTGLLARRLAAGGGAGVEGFDLSEDMIAIATAAAAREGARARFRVLDMAAMGTAWPAGNFDLLLCLGSSIAHLPRAGDVEAFLRAAHGLLVPGGALVVQSLNYDRMLREGLTEIPPRVAGAARLERRYERRGEVLAFITTFVEGEERGKDETLLRPLLLAELDAALGAAGFAGVGHFADCARAELRDDSLGRVTIARR